MKCTKCQRQFKTQAALAQHVRDKHREPGKAPAKSRSNIRNAPRGAMSVMTTSGKDLLTSLSVAQQFATGKVLQSQLVSPIAFAGTRLGAEGRLWSKWRPTKLNIVVQGVAPATYGGAICVAWVPDVTIMPPDSNRGLAIALASERNVTVRLDSRGVLSIPCSGAPWLQTDGSAEFAAFGQVVFVLVAPPIGGSTNGIRVTATLDWTLQWQGRELFDKFSLDTIYPDPGWTDLFTTSDGSWDAGYLTFKMHSGGDMVPWSSAHEKRVYVPTARTKVYYKNSSSVDTECKFFARIKGYATPGLALFSSAENAKNYLETGDKTKCLPYVAASKYATPSAPSLVAMDLAAVAEEDPLPAAVNVLADRMETQSRALVEASELFRLTEDRLRDAEEEIDRLRHRLESVSSQSVVSTSASAPALK